MILRLEHVHHVRTERLRRLDDERVRRVLLAADVNGAVARCTAMPDLISALTKRTDEPKSGASDGMMKPRGSRFSFVV